jgi:AbrB family looped-hinge helix DNA binding protein
METIRLSSKGQVIIPKSVRNHYQWAPGQELQVLDTDDGVLLRTRKPFEETALADVAGILAYRGKPKTLDDMAAAIRHGIEHKHRDRR